MTTDSLDSLDSSTLSTSRAIKLPSLPLVKQPPPALRRPASGTHTSSPSIPSGIGSPSQLSIAGKRSVVRTGRSGHPWLLQTGTRMWAAEEAPVPGEVLGDLESPAEIEALPRHHDQVSGPGRPELVQQLIRRVGPGAVPARRQPVAGGKDPPPAQAKRVGRTRAGTRCRPQPGGAGPRPRRSLPRPRRRRPPPRPAPRRPPAPAGPPGRRWTRTHRAASVRRG